MALALAEKGYAETTVADSSSWPESAAGPSTSSSRARRPAVLAAYDYGVEYVLGAMAEAAGADPRRRLARPPALRPGHLPRDPGVQPAFAWALARRGTGCRPGGPRAPRGDFALFSERTRRAHEIARTQDPGLPELPEAIFRLHTGGMDELVRGRLRTGGGAANLVDLTEPAIEMTLALFGDTGTSIEVGRGKI